MSALERNAERRWNRAFQRIAGSLPKELRELIEEHLLLKASAMAIGRGRKAELAWSEVGPPGALKKWMSREGLRFVNQFNAASRALEGRRKAALLILRGVR